MRQTYSALLALLLALGGCGARTGLFWGDNGDGGVGDTGPAPDVFGPFPCAFFPAGRPVSVRENRPPFSVIPQLSFGGGRLGLTFALRTNLASADGSFAFCDTHRDDGYLCPTEEGLGTGLPSPAPVVWNGESFGACWNGLDASGIPVPRFATFSATGELLSEPIDLDDEYGVCLDLVWSGERYVAALIYARTPDAVTLDAFDRDGRFVGSPLAEVTDLNQWQVGSLAGDAGLEVAAWTNGSTITIRRVDRSDGVELTPPAGGELGMPVVAMRRPMTGLFWHAVAGETTLYFELIDMESGVETPPLELARTDGEVLANAIVAVNEGFLVAWAERGRDGSRIMVISLSVDGWEVHPWEPIDFFEGDADELDGEVGGPSLVYDGRSVFVAYSSLERTTGRFQVRLQELDCHR